MLQGVLEIEAVVDDSLVVIELLGSNDLIKSILLTLRVYQELLQNGSISLHPEPEPIGDVFSLELAVLCLVEGQEEGETDVEVQQFVLAVVERQVVAVLEEHGR